MPVGPDRIREKYFHGTHPNRKTKKKTGFEGNNWPSTRTYYSDLSIEVVALTKKFQFYTFLLYGSTRISYLPIHLEKISGDIGYYVSNYTISGLLNNKWGPRHNPKPTTVEAIVHLIEWMEKKARSLKIYKPFKFRPHPEDIPKKQNHECKKSNKQNRKKEAIKPVAVATGNVNLLKITIERRSFEAS